MPLSPYHGGALRVASSFKIKVAGVLRTARTLSVYADGALHPFFSTASSLDVTAPDVSGTHHATVTTDATTMTPTGGTAPYSYAWTLLGGSGDTPTINNAAFATTTFTQTDGGSGDDLDVWTVRGTVTDALSATATVDITVSFQHVSAGGGGS